MVGDRVGGGSSSSGSSGGGGVSMGWVEGNFVSKDFFNQLFTIHGTRTYVDPDTEEEVTEDVIITPNMIADGDEYNLSNVEVSVGLWTKQFLSALGLNPAGGGGDGVTALADLTDVQITDLQPGQMLKYSNGKWRNVDDTPSGVTSVGLSMPTGFTVNGSPVTNRGTLQVTFASGYSLPSNARQNEWDTVYNWYAENPLSGYATQSWVNSQGFLKSSDLNGYATQTWVNNQNYVKQGSSPRLRSIEFSAVPSTAGDGGYIDFHYNGNEGDYTSRIIESAQGRLALNNTAFFYLTNVTGADIVSPVTGYSSRNFRVRMTNSVLMDTLCLSGSLIMRNAQGISMMDTNNTELRALRVDTGNNLVLGENFQNYNTYVRGNALFLQTGSSNTEALRIDANGNVRQYHNNTSYVMRDTSGGDVTMMRIDSSNVLEYGYGSVTPNYQTNLYGGSTKGIGFYAGGTLVASIYKDENSSLIGLKIGEAMLSWDSANNALKLSRPDGTAANFYAMGGVSALGLSGTGGASVTQLNVTEALNFDNNTRLRFRNAAGSLMSAMTVDSGNNLVLGEAWSASGYNTYIRGNYVFIQTGASYTTRMTINSSGYTTFGGYVQAPRFYLDSSRYLHVSSGHLYFYNGTSDSLII